jgi:Uma2 family endonuclease
MEAEKKAFITVDEYLKIERSAKSKSEYFNGEMFAMAGATRNHQVICDNILFSLKNQIKNKHCIAFGGDLRVKVNKAGLYTYPDISALCGKELFDDEEKDTLTNPQLIIEVLSDSTEAYDRGKKFAFYRQIESLKEYILVSQSSKKIERFAKNETGFWTLSETNSDTDILCLSALECNLSIEDVYDKVEFSELSS